MAHDAHHAEGHAHAHWDTSIYPFIISFGILALAVAFSFKFVYHNGFAAILSLGIGPSSSATGTPSCMWMYGHRQATSSCPGSCRW